MCSQNVIFDLGKYDLGERVILSERVANVLGRPWTLQRCFSCIWKQPIWSPRAQHILNTKIHKFKYLSIFLLDLKTSKYGCLHNTNSYNITKYHNIHLGKYVFEGNQCNIARKENQIGSWGVTCWMNTWIWNYLIVKPFVLLLEDMRKGEKV